MSLLSKGNSRLKESKCEQKNGEYQKVNSKAHLLPNETKERVKKSIGREREKREVKHILLSHYCKVPSCWNKDTEMNRIIEEKIQVDSKGKRLVDSEVKIDEKKHQTARQNVLDNSDAEHHLAVESLCTNLHKRSTDCESIEEKEATPLILDTCTIVHDMVQNSSVEDRGLLQDGNCNVNLTSL